MKGNADLTRMSSSLFSEANNEGVGLGIGFEKVIDKERKMMKERIGEL